MKRIIALLWRLKRERDVARAMYVTAQADAAYWYELWYEMTRATEATNGQTRTYDTL
jgi:hypothetical protein